MKYVLLTLLSIGMLGLSAQVAVAQDDPPAGDQAVQDDPPARPAAREQALARQVRELQAQVKQLKEELAQIKAPAQKPDKAQAKPEKAQAQAGKDQMKGRQGTGRGGPWMRQGRGNVCPECGRPMRRMHDGWGYGQGRGGPWMMGRGRGFGSDGWGGPQRGWGMMERRERMQGMGREGMGKGEGLKAQKPEGAPAERPMVERARQLNRILNEMENLVTKAKALVKEGAGPARAGGEGQRPHRPQPQQNP